MDETGSTYFQMNLSIIKNKVLLQQPVPVLAQQKEFGPQPKAGMQYIQILKVNYD